MERVAPRQVLYENQLPLAIESTSSRRIFFPEGGSTYGPTGGGANPNIVRIPINSDDLLDPSESFLQFKFTNRSGDTLGLDTGVPFIRRLRIESSGTTLEDINEYGRLYAQLVACQASSGALAEATLTTGGSTAVSGALTPAAAFTAANTGAIGNTAAASPAIANDGALTAALGGAAGGFVTSGLIQASIDAGVATGIQGTMTTLRGVVNNQIDANLADIRAKVDAKVLNLAGHHQANTQVADGASVYYNVPLVSALLNCKKYLPLVFMNGGLVLECEFDVPFSCGVVAGGNPAAMNWDISNVRYIAHMISLQRDFYDKLRMVMEGSGGVLQLSGTTYRHFQNTYADSTSVSVPLPAKVKSLKGVLFTETNPADVLSTKFYIGDSLSNGLTEYQLRVGSVVHPPTSIKLDQANNVYVNKGEAYQELRKLFGTLGDYTHGGILLTDQTYLAGNPNADSVATGAANVVANIINPKGISLDAFPRTNLESGINSADQNLSMSLELKRISRAGGGNTRLDMWCMCDALFYVNLDGSVSSSV